MTENVRCAPRWREFSQPTAPATRGVPARIGGTREQVFTALFAQADAE
ncbi:hypothetical protein [Streptomyces sp. NBC_00986]|nr:hypothetical protein OG504_09610 [Streptomyces sp. NBC_00986]